ncbi:ATP-binding cassette domain-containing protein [Reinekea sp.]|jgi:ATP-binding cassette subfamily F protein uup|uniref:ATP-binding cassette domain-containing protein n=2 Tax=Reinekea sp. TaxID=1970455 RepID=UPI00398959B2
MSLIIFDQVSFALGAAPLLNQCSFSIEKNERVALVGRNGAGKSTLLKLTLEQFSPDSGVIKYSKGLKLSYLQQDLPVGDDEPVGDVILKRVGAVGEAILKYNALTVSDHPDMDELEKLQHYIEENDGWKLQNQVQAICTKLNLNPDKRFNAMSGGWRRRVLLASALVVEPDVLILDEPTNHLDIKMVEWLEDLLINFKGTVLFVSHDRAFIDRIATRVIDLDRGKIASYPAPYETYLEFKEKALEDEAKQRAQEDKVLAQEEVWIRQGIKARRTRNEGRVRALKAMRAELSERRFQQGSAKFKIEMDDASGKRVVELDNVVFGFGDQPIINGFTSTVLRGDKIALLGPNGVGKTTALKLLLGDLKPQSGTITEGTRLQVAYFDQAREALDPEKPIVDVVSEGRDFLEIQGKRRHVISYLEDFLFKPERLRMKVRQLSGGEINRLLLAKMFSQAANVLVLDEPTNDLDMDTLDLLIDRLSDFEGTVLLVSHDRYFIDQLATKSWAFEGNGVVKEYAGGYEDWKIQGGKWPDLEKMEVEPMKVGVSAKKSDASVTKKAQKKLSYKDQREFDLMPAMIEKLELEIETLEADVAAPDFYNQSSNVTTTVLAKLESVQQALNHAYERWAELESLVN